MSVRIAPGASSRQRRIGERLEPQACDPLERCLDRKGVGREHRVWTGGQERPVLECLQPHAVRGCCLDRLQRRPGLFGCPNRLLPSVLCLAQRRRRRLHLFFEPIDLRLHPCARLLLLRRGQVEPRLEKARPVAERTALVVSVGEERQHPEVVFLAERIVLVVVALRAGQRRAEPDGRGRVHAIDEDFVQRFLRIDAAFLVGHRIAVKPGGDFLVDGRIGQHVASDLLDRELVERQIAVERVNHPVAVFPDAATIVLLVAVGVGVAREIEPRPRPAFAVVR